ncbi:MAG: septum formation initiator family protein [Candidatus Limnocylindria bacterium]
MAVNSQVLRAPRPRTPVRPPRVAATFRASARSGRRVPHGTWELRSFAGAAAAILVFFLVALVYVSATTTLSATGYESQRLEQQRDELRRQNALLEVEVARLDSPTRVVAEAKRLGLVHPAQVTVVSPESLSIKR